MGLKAREKDREEGSLGLRGTQREVWHLPHPLSSPPRGWRERKGLWGAPGGHLTFSDGAIRGGSVVSDKKAGSVPVVAAPASGGDRALVFWRHGWLVDRRAVLVGQCSGCGVPIGTGVYCKVRSHRQNRD